MSIRESPHLKDFAHRNGEAYTEQTSVNFGLCGKSGGITLQCARAPRYFE
jgi:hypothetical protein